MLLCDASAWRPSARVAESTRLAAAGGLGAESRWSGRLAGRDTLDKA